MPIELCSGTEIKAGSSRRISPQKPAESFGGARQVMIRSRGWDEVQLSKNDSMLSCHDPSAVHSVCLTACGGGGSTQQHPAGLWQVPFGFKIATCNYCQIFSTRQKKKTLSKLSCCYSWFTDVVSFLIEDAKTWGEKYNQARFYPKWMFNQRVMLCVNVYACVCVALRKREVSPVVLSAASTLKLVIINCPVWKTWKLGVRVCTGRRCHLDRVWLGFNL